jgi:hypothetical protein
MNNRARSGVNSTASSGSEGLASALRKSIDQSLVVESGAPNREHSKTRTTHSKSTTEGPVLPKLSDAGRERALRLAERLASSHSD